MRRARADHRARGRCRRAALRSAGEELAKRGQYAEAIEQFKAADKLEPRVQHACMIGLAYLRRSMWAQAELFLARCKQRARSGEELPAWIGDAEAQLAEGLASAAVSSVHVVVTPATVAASVHVSGFAADETFDPQTLHLPAGQYTLTITTADREPITREITLTGTGETVDVAVDLAAKPLPPAQLVEEQRNPWGPRLLVGAGIAAAAGVTLHVFAARTRDRLDAAQTVAQYEKHETTFDVQRAAALASYGVAAVALGASMYFLLHAPERSVIVSGTPVSGGGMISIGWQR